MSQFVLFIAPGTCSRVPTIVLEHLGVPYETRVVRFMARQHKSAAYRAYNPKGKVPALLVDGEPITENVAIIGYLNTRFPEARVLPPALGAIEAARQTADLCFCSSTLHPIVTRIRLPAMLAGADAAGIVRSTAELAMDEYFRLIEDRLNVGGWWYGDE